MRQALRRTAAVVGASLVLLLVYGVAIEPRVILDDRRYTVPIPGLDEAWEGTEVAVFADLQTGMWWANEGMVERIVARVVQERPDAALIAGDFLYSSSPSVDAQVGTVMRQLAPLLDAGIPTYAVLGNHDYAVDGAPTLTAALEEAGIPVLQNEAVVLGRPGTASAPAREDALHLVGLGATRPGLTDVDAALADLPDGAPRIVLMHNPTVFDGLPAGSAPLAVAGHTHCGQVALPGAPRWSYVGLTTEERVVADGWAPPGYGAEGNALFVTCGIGFSLAPIRVNAAPQVVFFTLTGDT